MKKSWGVLIITFSILTFILTASILYKITPRATFFTIDPDAVYLGNSLLYIVANNIGFNTHPGTPTILLHSFIFWPIRFYTHYFLHSSFIEWVYQNMYFTFHYVRYFQSLLLSVSVGIFLLAIYKRTKSKASVLLAFPAILTFSNFPYFGITIVPETFSFFLVSVWLLVFSYFEKSKSPFIFVSLSLIAGIAVANKFTNLPLALITILLSLTIPNLNLKQRFMNATLAIVLIAFAFLVCTWPIRNTYPYMFKWIGVLASTTGVQGGGKQAFFDWQAYHISIKSLYATNRIPSYLVIISFVSVVISLVLKKSKLFTPINLLALGTFISILIFSKYYLSYYQLANFALVIYLLSVTINFFPVLLKIILAGVLIFPATSTMANFYGGVLRASQKVVTFENYIVSNQASIGTVWQWGRAKDFATIWIRDWTGGVVFGKNIEFNIPYAYELNPDFNTIKTPENNTVDLFDRCWDHLYIVNSVLNPFLEKHSQFDLKYQLLSGTDDMVLVISPHCLSD